LTRDGRSLSGQIVFPGNKRTLEPGSHGKVGISIFDSNDRLFKRPARVIKERRDARRSKEALATHV
jgi:hypothetical protein